MRSDNSDNNKRKKRAPRRHLPRIVWRLLTLLLIVAVGVCAWMFGTRHDRIITSETVKLRFEDIGELATQNAYFRNVQVISDSRRIFNITVPLTRSRYVFSYDGVLKAGYDFTRIGVDVDHIGRKITVRLPEPQILSCEIDEDSLKVYDETHNVYSPLTLEDISASRAEMRAETIQEAEANGLMDSARENAETLIKTLLGSLIDTDSYTIEFITLQEGEYEQAEKIGAE